ncbi:MAG TPA: VOC family protein [Holophagaceae bacterium]|nr:VOC family protein [Holophagaceae bacterium]
MAVRPIPEGSEGVTPYLIVHDGAAALDFYARAFGAEEIMRMPGPDGRVAHSEMRIGRARFMVADEYPEMLAVSPKALGGTPVGLLVYLEGVDAVFDKAVAAGAAVERPVDDQFYGDRSGTLRDPFGHKWTFATHVEDLSAEEMERRAAAQGS